MKTGKCREEDLFGLDKVDGVDNANPFSATNNVKFLGALHDKKLVRGSNDGFYQTAEKYMSFYSNADI